MTDRQPAFRGPEQIKEEMGDWTKPREGEPLSSGEKVSVDPDKLRLDEEIAYYEAVIYDAQRKLQRAKHEKKFIETSD